MDGREEASCLSEATLLSSHSQSCGAQLAKAPAGPVSVPKLGTLMTRPSI